MTYVHPPPDVSGVWTQMSPERLASALGPHGHEAGEYLHWDKLRHLDPPGDLSHEEWWAALKLTRTAGARAIPLTDPDGAPFWYSLPDGVLRRLNFIDQRCSGEIAMEEVVTADSDARHHYLVNSLMEEAIRSSQLEGATTTRRVAKELLRSGRAPRDRSERMILNNYRALEFMRTEIGERLTPAAVLELQRILTQGPLPDDGAAGRLQTVDDERVVVGDRLDGTTLHVPPPAEQLPARLDALCAFANAGDDDRPFVHPVVRGVLLHFWLAYDHPFEDGNGRTARALFYWYMRTRGYWLVEYLSISRILRKAPAQYGRSFLLTESDGGDATYFLLYQLEVIERAVDELHRYLRRRTADIREVEQLLRGAAGFNGRQLALLGDALRHPERIYTFGGHATIHGVTHETARTDIAALADRRLLERHQEGRRYFFMPPADLADRLRRAR